MSSPNIWEILSQPSSGPLPAEGVSEEVQHLRWQYTVMTAIMSAQKGNPESFHTLQKETPERTFSMYDVVHGERQFAVGTITWLGDTALYDFQVYDPVTDSELVLDGQLHQLIPVRNWPPRRIQ